MKATSLTIPALILALIAQAVAYAPCHSAAPEPGITAMSPETERSAHHPAGHAQHIAQSDSVDPVDQSADDAMDCCDDSVESTCAAAGCAVSGGATMVLASTVVTSLSPKGSVERSPLWLRPYSEPDKAIFRPPIA